MQYITKRKLLNAIYEISLEQKMIDTALSYGFTTYAGFCKSFVRETGHTPKQYLSRYRVNRPCRVSIMQEEHIIMTQKKIREILTRWAMENEKLADIVYEETGSISECARYVGENHVIIWTTNPGLVRKVIDIARALKQDGLASADILPTTDSADYVEEEGLYWFLSRRLRGERIKAWSLYSANSIGQARFIGEIVRQLSLTLEKLDIPVEEKDLLGRITDWALPRLVEQKIIKEDAAALFCREFGRMYPLLPRQIIHRDPNPGNILVRDSQWGFIDFDLRVNCQSKCSSVKVK